MVYVAIPVALSKVASGLLTVIRPSFWLGAQLARREASRNMALPLRTSRAPELALKTALTMELRAKVAFCTTAVKSLVGSAKAFSISVTAALTLVMAESVFGKPTALARYSPISDESFVNFLRLSSCCLAETSAVAIAPAVTPTILVVVEVDWAALALTFPSISVAFSRAESILRPADSFVTEDSCSVAVAELLCSTDRLDTVEKLPGSLVDWLILVEVLTEALVEVLLEVLSEALREVLFEALTDELLDTDSDIEVLSLKEVDKLAEFSELFTDVVPKTTVSFVTKRSGFSSVFSTATVSFANTFVWVATVPPKTAPVAASPLIISRPVIEGFTLSSTTSVMTWVVSTPPRKTLNKPKREVEARNQCFPDLINLYRVTRSVSLYSPFWRLKNMIYPFVTFLKWTIHPILIILL